MSIRTSTANGVSTIEMARPGKKNALTAAMYEAMTDAVNAALKDDGVRALLVTGQPEVFTAGNDLEDFMQRPPTGEDSPVFRFMQTLAACDKPVVAAVTGAAVGIGTTMLLHCDLVYVSRDARLVMPFVSLGLVPEFGASLLLPRLVGQAKAAEKLLLGDAFTGAEAVEMGLANASLPAAEVLPHAKRMAERFNDLPAGAVRQTKRLLRAGVKVALSRAMRAEGAVFIDRLRSAEAQEALRAFLEKRRPNLPRA